MGLITLVALLFDSLRVLQHRRSGRTLNELIVSYCDISGAQWSLMIFA